MAERGIIFGAPMICALLAGRKTMTRRLVSTKDTVRGGPSLFNGEWADAYVLDPGNASWREAAYPYRIGDRLWVREAYSGPHAYTGTPPRDWHFNSDIWYWADGNPEDGDWTKPKPGMHMPRWASRLTLTVIGVKVERLNDLTEADALAEGVAWDADKQWFHVPGVAHPDKAFSVLSRVTAREMFAALWDVIHGSGAWLASPWVVAVSFTVALRNIDAEEAVAA